MRERKEGKKEEKKKEERERNEALIKHELMAGNLPFNFFVSTLILNTKQIKDTAKNDMTIYAFQNPRKWMEFIFVLVFNPIVFYSYSTFI